MQDELFFVVQDDPRRHGQYLKNRKIESVSGKNCKTWKYHDLFNAIELIERVLSSFITYLGDQFARYIYVEQCGNVLGSQQQRTSCRERAEFPQLLGSQP
jgi:hypothetical protein